MVDGTHMSFTTSFAFICMMIYMGVLNIVVVFDSYGIT